MISAITGASSSAASRANRWVRSTCASAVGRRRQQSACLLCSFLLRSRKRRRRIEFRGLARERGARESRGRRPPRRGIAAGLRLRVRTDTPGHDVRNVGGCERGQAEVGRVEGKGRVSTRSSSQCLRRLRSTLFGPEGPRACAICSASWAIGSPPMNEGLCVSPT